MCDEKDIDLLQAWSGGDSRAGDRLIRRHNSTVRRYFNNKVPTGEVADLIQETFLQCTRSLKKFRQEASFQSFLLGIARNMLRHYYRTHKRRFSRVDPLTHSVAELSGPGMLTVLQSRGNREQLRWGMAQLPINLQDALQFKLWEGMTDKESAGILEIPEGTYRNRVKRARQLLCELLTPVDETTTSD